MLSRLLARSSHLRLLSVVTSTSGPYPPPPLLSHHPRQDAILASFARHFSSSSSQGNGGRDPKFSDPWMFSKESDGKVNNIFNDGSAGNVGGISERAGGEGDDWLTADGSQMWKLGEEEAKDDMFDLGGDTAGTLAEIKDDTSGVAGLQKEMTEEERAALTKEAEELTELVKGPNRAFGDLIAISGISDTMLDSLIALKDFQGIDGLPPLSVIEEIRYEKTTRKSVRAEIERLKQEEIAKSRVRKVDDKGRAYGTGRRKCSIARVWIEPGSGKFSVNDKEFDVYFPMLDNRATLLRPFVETKTLGLWDVTCTVKGGGTTGQVGAIRLGISRALQNWEPGLRPPLKKAGFLTRDPRVVERKKPGKAKARKSFQWVKR